MPVEGISSPRTAFHDPHSRQGINNSIQAESHRIRTDATDHSIVHVCHRISLAEPPVLTVWAVIGIFHAISGISCVFHSLITAHSFQDVHHALEFQ